MNNKQQNRKTIEERGYLFAARIYKLFPLLRERMVDITIARQVLRSGTSVGANLAEAGAAFSRAELAAKTGISFKELRETQFWLRLLHEHGMLSDKEYESINSDANELGKILFSSLRRLKRIRESQSG